MSETKIEFLPGYEITSDGHVWSISSNWRGYGRREMRQHDGGKGYLVVRLTVSGLRKKYHIHKLVAENFIGPRPSRLHEIRHLDGNPLNNNVANLAWGTRSENARDRVRHGRQYMPDWGDPEWRKKTVAAMKKAKKALAKAEGRS